MEKTIDVIVCGHLCLDMLPTMDQVQLGELPTPGHLFEVGPMHVSTGGVVSNTGLALQRLGIAVRLMSNVGDDLLGRMILAFLANRDPVLTEHIRVKKGSESSYSVVLSPEKVDRIFLHYTGTNASFNSADVDYGAAAQARIFHLGYPPLLPGLIADAGEEITSLFQRVKAAGTITSLDMTLPDPQSFSGRVDYRRLLTRALPYIDIFVPSIEETLYMLRRSDFDRWHGNILNMISAPYLDDLADELFALGETAIVGFKLGELGLYLRTGGLERISRLAALPLNPDAWTDRCIWQPAYVVDVVGTTGAGDSAYAGFLAALIKGLTPDDAAGWACAVGACNVEAADATSGVQTWTATAQRIAAGWPLSAKRLPGC